MIDMQKKKDGFNNSSDDVEIKAVAHGDIDSFTLKRLCDEKLSIGSATRLLNNIRVWYPETEEIISQADFNNRESILNAVKKVREILVGA